MLHGSFKCESEKAQDGCPEYRLSFILVAHLAVDNLHHHYHQCEVIYTSKFPTFSSLLCSPQSPHPLGYPRSQFELSNFITNCDSLRHSFINFSFWFIVLKSTLPLGDTAMIENKWNLCLLQLTLHKSSYPWWMGKWLFVWGWKLNVLGQIKEQKTSMKWEHSKKVVLRCFRLVFPLLL